ncbi:MAG TPA: hypothetical protein DIW43_17395 [Spongiibacteraceae bacterium]|nr:hypothetical protein [Spongiibacteraceae bacterium]HCS29236.1 hypothetical protein [Spongiibacteraceae bacterium]|tara:strand:+ start:3009 stop:4079 length:1071 start_codon:yes stop_codon:yes gene_type:complete
MVDATKPKSVPIAIALISLLAIPFSYAVAYLSFFHDNPSAVLGVGVIALVLPAVIAYALVFRHMPDNVRKDPFLYIFTVFAFACVLDLLIGFTLMGYTDVMAWYFASGEPYLNTAHGMAINIWDGTVHYALYLTIAYQMAAGKSYRRTGLIWVGSMMGSGMVFLVGNLIGVFANHVEPSYLLNVPFMLVPIFIAWRIFGQSSPSSSPAASAGTMATGALTIALLSLAGFSLFRLLVAFNPETGITSGWAGIEPYLQSPMAYPRLQIAVYAFWLAPFCLIAALSLWRTSSQGISHWAWIFVGVVCQGQFAHIIAGMSDKNEAAYQIASGSSATFVIANIAVAAVVVWLALRQSAATK